MIGSTHQFLILLFLFFFCSVSSYEATGDQFNRLNLIKRRFFSGLKKVKSTDQTHLAHHKNQEKLLDFSLAEFPDEAQPGYMVDLVYTNSDCTGVASQVYAFEVNECVKVDTFSGTVSYKQMVVPTNDPNKYNLTGQQFESPDCSGPDEGEDWNEYLSSLWNQNFYNFNSCNQFNEDGDEFITTKFITNLDEIGPLSPDLVSLVRYPSILDCESNRKPYEIITFINGSLCAQYDESIWSRGLMCANINGTSIINDINYSDNMCVVQTSSSDFESCSFLYGGIATTLSSCPNYRPYQPHSHPFNNSNILKDFLFIDLENINY